METTINQEAIEELPEDIQCVLGFLTELVAALEFSLPLSPDQRVIVEITNIMAVAADAES